MFPGLPLPQEVRDAVDLLDLVDELTEAGRNEQAATAAALRGELIVDKEGCPVAPVQHTAVCQQRSRLAESWRCRCSGVLADYTNYPDDEDDGALDAAGETGGLTLPTEQERAEGLVPLFREQARAWLEAEHADMEEDLAALLARVAAECQA